MKKIALFSAIALLIAGCRPDNEPQRPQSKPLGEEWYAGGILGTAFNATSAAYEQPTVAVSNAGLSMSFLNGEALFEKIFMQSAEGTARGGL